MSWIDWTVVAAFCAASLALGLSASRRGGRSLDAYFVSNRRLGWWLAGTSMAATAFSSDTPLLITGMVRRRGLWGVWEVWALGISTMLTVFVFARLWRRAGVVTEVELVERRYSGQAAAVLRGAKAIYWGLLYNCYILGVWPVVGMTKVLQETTPWSREGALVACVVVGTAYTALAGLWGVVLTDAFQFVWAMAGSVLLAIVAVHAVGGLGALSTALADTPHLSVLPPMAGGLHGPLGWWLGLLCIQWWAWKNTDGGGVVVQRLVSCTDERQAMRAALWFNVAHYCLRSWPWILTALASLVLIPNAGLTDGAGASAFIDHERSYPRLIVLLLPAGLRGIMVAAFFAAFLSTVSTQLNWGASYLVNDVYKRFVRPRASDRHYLLVAKLCTVGLALGATGVALANRSIGSSFTWILHLTAGIGPVLLLRWCWWRINAWSELAAMVASPILLWLRPALLQPLGWPTDGWAGLAVMALGTTAVWLPVTLATAPVDRRILKTFYAQIRPPGWWRHVAVAAPTAAGWGGALWRWGVATGALLATTIGPLQVMVGDARWGWLMCGIAILAWGGLIRLGLTGPGPSADG